MSEHRAALFENCVRCLLSVLLVMVLAAQPMACAGSSAAQPKKPEDSSSGKAERLVIHHARLVSMTGNEPTTPQTLFIEGERIASIVDAAQAKPEPGDRVLDASGKFLLPGLADMHSHAFTRAEMVRYLAYGVTTLRIMAGLDDHLSARDAVAQGKEVGPTLIVASPIIDGDPPTRPELVAVSSAATARERVREYHQLGYDQIKLYHNLSGEAFLAALAEAHTLGLKAVGHTPIALATSDVFEAGYDSSEHFTGMLKAIQPEPPAFSDTPSSTEWSLRLAAGADPGRAAAIASVASQHGVRLVPTLCMHRVLEAPPEQWQTWSQDARVSQISSGAIMVWDRETAERATVDPALYEFADQAWQALLDITRETHEAGAELLVGTDYGMPYLFAGEAVHLEIENFVEAGLTPTAALAAATAAPAKFLGQEGEFGTVQAGARADLVLLDGDPTLDIQALDQISSVVVRGQLLERDVLDEMLETGLVPERAFASTSLEPCLRQASGSAALIEDFDDADPFITGDADLDDCWRQYSFSFEELTPVDWSPEQGPVNPAEITGV